MSPTEEPRNGDQRSEGGKPLVYYDGYWIRRYDPPRDTLAAKRALIEALGRRLFHHSEVGINTPAERVEDARAAYEAETDPRRRRVNGGMLAGALFNRATATFSRLVEHRQAGTPLPDEAALMTECEALFSEALALGRSVRHHSGEEGIDELWGEPLKAFALPVESFYESRYVKIAQTMRDIDQVAAEVVGVFAGLPEFSHAVAQVRELAIAAKLEAETTRSDPAIFTIWPRFVAATESFETIAPSAWPEGAESRRIAREGCRVLQECSALLSWLAGARVPMPKSTRDFIVRLHDYARRREMNATTQPSTPESPSP